MRRLHPAQHRHILGAAEIGLDHARVALHLRRRAEGQHLALVHRQHPVGDARDQRHVVLDHQHGDAELVADVVDPEGHVVGLLDVQARGRLVEQQQLRLGAQRPRQLDHLAHAVRQAGDQRLAVVLQVEQVDHPLDRLARRELGGPCLRREQQVRPEAGGAMRVPADQQVLQHGRVLEQLDVLEGAGDAERGDLVRRLRRRGGIPSNSISPLVGV